MEIILDLNKLRDITGMLYQIGNNTWHESRLFPQFIYWTHGSNELDSYPVIYSKWDLVNQVNIELFGRGLRRL